MINEINQPNLHYSYRQIDFQDIEPETFLQSDIPEEIMLAVLAGKTNHEGVAFGVTLYTIALHLNHVRWTPGKAALALAAPIGGALFFASIFVLSASLAFWWVDSGEIGNGFTYGGRDFTSYPITVYQGWFRGLFAYALGFGFVAYQPSLILLDRSDQLGLPAWAGYVSPLVCLPATLIAAVVWRSGVRHYRSTGS